MTTGEPEVVNSQVAPYPYELDDLVSSLRYRPGWTFRLEFLERDPGCEGLTLIVRTLGYNAYHPERGQHYAVHHYFPVPPATYDRRSWLHWLFERLLLIERHECMEFFALAQEGVFVQRDGSEVTEHVTRPFAPVHAPGADPYIVTELTTDLERRTSFRGEVNP